MKKTAIIPSHPPDYHWLRTGADALAEMLVAGAATTRSVRVEMYIFEPSPIANQFLPSKRFAGGGAARE